MRGSRSIALVLITAAVTWLASAVVGSVQAQNPQSPQGGLVRILGLGVQGGLPSDTDGRAYLPVQASDRQFTVTIEQWANSNSEVVPLLWNQVALPKQVTICGHRLAMVQGMLRNTPTDETSYFPITVNATGLTVPNDGCYSITPVAYLRIKGITTIQRTQLPNVVVMASY